jgi:ribonuclease HI
MTVSTAMCPRRRRVMSNVLIVYADGCCKGNPGPGGAACVMFAGDKSHIEAYIGSRHGKSIDPAKMMALEPGRIYKVSPEVYTCSLFEGSPETTNNIMELRSVQLALNSSFLRMASEKLATRTLLVITDSQYVVNTFNEWVPKWALNGWRTSGKKPVANQDIIKPMWNDLNANYDSFRFKYTPGHTGDYFNEVCDALSNRAVSEL